MKKAFVFFTVFVLLLTMAVGGGWANAAVKAKRTASTISRPDYHNLDPGLVEDAKKAGIQLKGKELTGYNGSSYKTPNPEGVLKLKDMTGQKNGIAILVDFPESTPGVSEVLGVNYTRIPAEKFDDLLNGTVYNPYDLEMFNYLAVFGDGNEKDNNGYGNPIELDNPITAPTDRTLRNYYDQASYGQFLIDVDVNGWYTLPKSYHYYLGQDLGYPNENGDAHIAELVKDAINLLRVDLVNRGIDPETYFKAYAKEPVLDDYGNEVKDENGNTLMQPNLFIIHRGTGAEYSRDPGIIWSHKWDIRSATAAGQSMQTGEDADAIYEATPYYKIEGIDGVRFNTYNICPEVGQDISGYLKNVIPVPVGYTGRAPSPPYPGVFCHEFGHVLGLPDQYDYGYDSEGTGTFTLMASGDSGSDIDYRWYWDNSPVHMDAWSKYYLGFISPVEITNSKSITLHPMAQLKENGGYTVPEVYRIDVPGSGGSEYFLLENRQQIGYDEGFMRTGNIHGLVVWHVDEDVLMRNFHRPNEAQNYSWKNRGSMSKDKATGETHYGIAVVQADGRFDMERYINAGDPDDTFPGNLGVTRLGCRMKDIPNTLSYYTWGNDVHGATGFSIENIKEENGIITCDVCFAE